MLEYLYNSLVSFRKVFSRHRTWIVFTIIVLGFIGCSEMVGVTSFCRFWLLDTAGYYKLLRFFRSTSWGLPHLLKHWFVFVMSQNQALFSQGRVVAIGDHTYTSKEGRRMPGVVTLHQDSETQSKPSYFRGQCWGALAVVVGSAINPFALPLMLKMHQGFAHIESNNESNALTLPEHMVKMALDFALKIGRPVVLTLDAYFAVKTVFQMAQSIYSLQLKAPLVEIIVKAKKGYVAYFQAAPEDYTGMGRPHKYGEEIHIMEVFDHLHLFQKSTIRIYGRLEQVPWLCLDLLWGPTAGLIRFVFAITSRGPIVLMCSNLNQDPLAAIELYCLRTRIETMFDMLKNVLHCFQYHFWSKKMPKHSRRPKSNKTLQAPKYEDLQTVQACWNAIEGFVNFGAIALGMLQLIALQFPNQIWNRFEGFLRTRSREIPSERTTKTVIAHLLLRDFCKVAPSATMREIHANILSRGVQEKSIRLDRDLLKEAA